MSNIPRILTVDYLRENYLANHFTPREVIETIIARANEDHDMNIWITPPTYEAIEPYLIQLESLNPSDHPLWGIPFAVKDNIDVVGFATTAACPDFTYEPSESATIVKKLIAAGAIPIGKTNLDQFATGLVGTRSPYGETVNAYHPELISGGSSSGSAVAVARGHAVFAIGTDTAGSGRVPAALNNLFGYKPSLGAWSKKGIVPACLSLDCASIFTHSTKEIQLIDSIVRGKDEQDPWSLSIASPTAASPEKIYLLKEEPQFFGPFAAQYEQAWQAFKQKLFSLNIPIEYIEEQLFVEAASILYDGPWVTERWTSVGEFIETHPNVTLPVTEKIIRNGYTNNYTASDLFNAMYKLQEIKQLMSVKLKNAVLVMPTTAGTWTRQEVLENPITTNNQLGKYTNHCNLLDFCAIAIPAGEAAPTVPFGATLFALSENEGLILGTANAIAAKEVTASKEVTKDSIEVAVCGLHMRGFPLVYQMYENGAVFLREDKTVAKYKLIKLPSTPPKPGLIKQEQSGVAIDIEVWEMPLNRLGNFVASIPAPLGIGKIELQDRSEVVGFICETYIESCAENISAYGGWKNFINQSVF